MSCDPWRVYGYTLASLLSVSPLAYAVLSSTPIVVGGEARGPVATDGRVVVVNRSRFCALPPPARMLALLHASFHLMGSHPERVSGLGDAGLVAADAVVDARLRDSGFKAGNEPLNQPTIIDVSRATGVPVERLKSMSLEEMASLLSRSGAASRIRRARGGAGSDILPPGSVDVDAAAREGRVVNPGPVDDATKLSLMEPGEVARLVRAKVEALSARLYSRGERKPGAAPGGTERRVEPAEGVEALVELLAYASGYSYTRFKRSWSRRSRRLPAYPGRVPFGPGRLWVLIDTSGSISDEELAWIVSAVAEYAALARPARIVLVEWDAGVRAVHEVESPFELVERARVGLRGGGGTLMAPALRLVAAESDPSDIAVVFSDYHVLDEKEALEAAAEAAACTRLLVPVAVGDYNRPFYEKLLGVTGTPPILLPGVAAPRVAR